MPAPTTALQQPAGSSELDADAGTLKIESVTRLLAAVVLFAGCADLPELDLEMCGNGLVEPAVGEDCDNRVDPDLGDGLVCGEAGQAGACRYVCGGTGGAPCPASWSCIDGICAHPTGRFLPWGGGTLGDAPEIVGRGDFDGDGVPDLGFRTTARFTVSYGTPSGAFTAGSDVPSLTSGRLAFDDLDLDGVTDMIVPVERGLVLLGGSAERQLRPIPGLQSVFLDAAEGFHIDVLPFDEGLLLSFVATERSLCLTTDCTLCANADHYLPVPAGLDGRRRLVVPAPRGTLSSTRAIAIAFEGDSEVLITAIGEPASSTTATCKTVDIHVAARVAMPGAVRALALADVDGDGALDLVAHVDGPSPAGQVAVAIRAIDRFGAARVEPFFGKLACASVPRCEGDRIELLGVDDRCGADPWPLGFGDLDGDQIDDVITGRGAFITRSDAAICVAGPSIGTWSDAVVHDFNADGRADMAAAVADLERLDFVLNGTQGRLTRVNYVTRGPPSRLVVADFDGDLVDDLGLSESTAVSRDPGHDVVSVAFGRLQGGLAAPVVMGRFDHVHDVVVKPEAGPAGLLVVTSSVADDTRGVRQFSILAGTPSRLMPSLLAPPEALSEARSARVGVALSGNIVPGTPAPDLLAAWSAGVWLMPSSAPGRYEPADMVQLEVSQCADRPPVEFDLSCVDAAVVRLSSGDPQASIVVVELPDPDCPAAAGRSEGLIAIFSVDEEVNVSCRIERVPVPTEGANVAMTTGDLDGNGHVELIVLKRRDGPVPGELGIYWDVGLPGVRDARLALPTDAAPISISAIDADRDPAAELALMAADGVHLLDAPGGQPAWRRVLGGSRPLMIGAHLLAGDQDGDGLDDIVVTRGAGFEVFRAESSLD